MLRRLKVCLNGARPGAPSTPDELATAAAAAVAAGAEAVHLHPRDHRGAESLRPDDVAAAVGAVREACPGVPVGVTTGLWICDGDVRTRHAYIAAWAELSQRPDFASVNVSEPGFGDVVEVSWSHG
jgi:uncharacterized protein (DUF849 family)